MSRPQKQRHLPLLYNPLLNCIFNNPNHSKPPFKNTIDELSHNHNDFTILVPPSSILHECYDPLTENSSRKVLLRELCYNSEDFIRSHIIKTSSSYSTTIAPISKAQLVIYNTTNGKQILIKNGMIFTGKGFKRSLKLKILSTSYMNSFCDYFPKGSKFMIIYIEDSMIGSVGRRKAYDLDNFREDLGELQGELKGELNLKKGKLDEAEINEVITFEKLLRQFPLLSHAVSDKFYKLFHHNNHQFRLLRTNTRKKLLQIRIEFQNMLEEAYKNILDSVKVDNPNSEQTYNLINHILNIYPGLDLNRLVHEYVEMNLYDKLWAQLLFQFNYPNDDKKSYDPEAFKILTAEKYTKLSCLALNQLDIPVDTPWDMNDLQERVFRAIDEFSRLTDTSIVSLNAKTKILLNTVSILTDNSSVSADSLIGLLIMVIVHSKIDNLETHLYYIKHFNSIDYTNDGQFNYIISNFEAVLYHLSSNNEPDLFEFSRLNFLLWSTIQAQDSEKLSEILEGVQLPEDVELPESHFLKSRNIHGETCLMFAVRSKNFEIYDKLFNFNTKWFSIEDILFCKNITSDQNLLMVALSEECAEISDDLVDMILANTSVDEQKLYFNQVDKSGRSVGHYLFHNYRLISVIGHLINWELKDLNSHTPLLSLCRCYDHPEYGELISEGFKCIFNKYGTSINFDKHIDKMGNTLLHIILKDLNRTDLLTRDNLININQENNKNMIPLVLYVKYNRLENLKELLNDNRLDFLYEDSKNVYNVFDYLGFLAMKSVVPNKTFNEIELVIYAHFIKNFFPGNGIAALNAKYGPNKRDWMVFCKDTAGYSNFKMLDTIKQIIQLSSLEHPFSLFPDQENFWLNFSMEKSSTPFFLKFRINRLIENLNMLFVSVKFDSSIDEEWFFRKFLVESRTPKLTLEMIKEIQNKLESDKAVLGEVKMTSNHIQEMEVFLNYSLADLREYEVLISKFNKVVAFGDAKQSDLRIVTDRALSKFFVENILGHGDKDYRHLHAYKLKECKEILGDLDEYHKNDSRLDLLHSYGMWLELLVTSLIQKIRKLVDKIIQWKEIYHEIKELNEELKKFEIKDETEPRRRNTFTIEPLSDADLQDDTSQTFFKFAGIRENKKTRYNKVVLAKSDKIKQIMTFNVDIKWEHEKIASLISNFLKFKSNFFKFGIKQYVQAEMVRLRHRHLELRMLLAVLKDRPQMS